MVSLIMSSLDTTVVSTALPKISTQFHSKDEYTWIFTAYLLGSISFQPMFGNFADILGRRPSMLFALTLFIITSLTCGAAQNMGMLITSRGFQGVAGGGIISMVNIIIADIVPLKRRGIYMGLTGAVFSFASIVGPVIGGLITDNWGWRWVFYINLPIGIISIIIISIIVKIPTPKGSLMKKIKKIDILGTIFLVLTTIPTLLALNWGGSKYNWSSKTIILLFVGSSIGLIIYLFVEWKIAPSPLTPFEIFKIRNVALSCLISFTLGVNFFGYANTVGVFYQDGRGLTAINCGIRMIPVSITVSLANILSGYFIGKYGYVQRYIIFGSISMIITSYLISLFDMDSKPIVEMFIIGYIGIGVGSILQNTTLITQQSVEKKYIAIGTTLNNFFRLIGGVMGVALIDTVTSNKFKAYYNERYPGTNVNINDIHNIPDGEETYVDAFLIGYRAVLVPSAILTFIFSLFFGFVPGIGNRKKEKKMNEKQHLNGKSQ
ncbi:MFS general substrate transporter [Anaeromyces robustus]|uniref:MFS general substrate transporter n=1 Tax=Anaeromyces robustus TaxID=1754192 RepID=A0A1Y1X6R8_9FUNG|nr:MFS general substrate transporter [Anaeromyces robustus]|eukprot:ORX81490.1 MFS general substrate transporter [Anaeromyces robustus]